MPRYSFAYRWGITPWERYPAAAAESVRAVLDREESDRPRPLGRALDLGCGRGLWTLELVRRGWDTVGVDEVPQVIDAARAAVPGAHFVVGNVTDLAAAGLGTFDLLLDVGCFQGLSARQRRAEARSAAVVAAPGATLLLLALGPSRLRALVGGASTADVEAAFADGWDLLSVEPADTAGLRWPLDRTAPQWFRMRRRDGGPGLA